MKVARNVDLRTRFFNVNFTLPFEQKNIKVTFLLVASARHMNFIREI